MAKVVPFKGGDRKTPERFLRKVPKRPRNADVRSREYLTADEVEALRKAAKGLGRHGHRDATLILMMYRHGLRVSEAVDTRWDQINLRAGRIHVNRLKNGNPSIHYLEGDESRALRRLRRETEADGFVFVTERGGPMTRSTVNKMISRAGQHAGLAFPVHPHMLRHGCGFYLANKGVDTRVIQDFLGHKSIAHTVRYTQLTPDRFKGLWR